MASDTEKGRTEVVWHILWLVVLIDDPKDQHVFSGSNYQPVMIDSYDLSYYLCEPAVAALHYGEHMLTIC